MWFVVPLYFRSSEPLGGENLLEEALHLIEATSEEEATEKAQVLSVGLEHRYRNVLGKEVSWSLEEIGEPWEVLDTLKDGAEVYSRFMTEKDREAQRQPLPAK